MLAWSSSFKHFMPRGEAVIPRTLLGSLALLTLGLSACGAKHSEPVSPKYSVEFHMTNDDGQSLAGVEIDVGKNRVGTSDAEGMVKTDLSGAEGQTLPVAVSCPEGFTNPEKLTPLRLAHTRRVTLDGYQPLHVEATCRRNVRDIVVVVRARGGADLPLQVDGKSAGVTDADGIAHVLVRADRNTASLKVALDTSAHQELKPKNPSRTFELAGNDAILVFDQTFVSSPKPVFHVGPGRPKRHIPYRVN